MIWKWMSDNFWVVSSWLAIGVFTGTLMFYASRRHTRYDKSDAGFFWLCLFPLYLIVGDDEELFTKYTILWWGRSQRGDYLAALFVTVFGPLYLVGIIGQYVIAFFASCCILAVNSRRSLM